MAITVDAFLAGRKRYSHGLFCGCLLIFGAFDQIPVTVFSNQPKDRRLFYEDQFFIGQLESRLPADQSISSASASATPSAFTRISPVGSNLAYNLGDVVTFGVGGGSERFRQDGWSGTEKDFTWTSARSAKLLISVPAIDQRLKLRMKLSGFTKASEASEPPFQPVEVIVNGQKVADWEVGSSADFTAIVPSEIAKDGNLTIELKVPKAFSPKSAGMSADPRLLGVACYEFSITAGD